MRPNRLTLVVSSLLALGLSACQPAATPETAPSTPAAAATASAPVAARDIAARVDDYAVVRLTTDLAQFSESQRRMLALLIQAGQQMDAIFWQQVWGDPKTLLDSIADPATRRFVEIQYGPWDRLNNDAPFVEGIGARPKGARFYPEDMSREEFEAAALPDKTSPYTLLRRDAAGQLMTQPYSEAYRPQLEEAARLLRAAAELSEDAGFANYLRLCADALLSNDYQPSDMAWMDMKTNPVDVVIGPIETYQDALFGYKAAFEAFVLVKDQAWSAKLARFAQHLPALQRDLPVEAAYKAEMPGSDADLNAYDAIYYAGDANAGGKTIAINLPNDEAVQLAKGSRRLQLKNVIQAKFDKIMQPIAAELIVPEQLGHVKFDAFFENVMFHEVAHGLGIKHTINQRGTVREALKDVASSFEEGKADILGLYMIGKLGEMGELDADKLHDNYVTFLAGIFRSVRFGATSAHGQANMVAFNFLQEAGAFSRDEASGRYRVDFAKMRAAVDVLSAKLLKLQGDGDYAGAQALLGSHGAMRANLQGDLKRIEAKAIPVDIVFEQGLDVLGLKAP